MTAEPYFSTQEITRAFGFAVGLEVVLFLVLGLAKNTAKITAEEVPIAKPIPIEVRPMLDPLPLLKLGGKRVKAKLPDMWKKKPPIKRYKATSAPSPEAGKTVEDIVDTPLAKPDAEAPPPDAKLAKEVDEIPETDASPDDPNIDEEGSADGVQEGTEADPLKAYAISRYRMKLSAWFNRRFRRPTKEIPCEELKKLRASVVAHIGQDRSVTSFAISKPSGNSIFDSRVKATMTGVVSQHALLPPPPPNYPDVLGTTLPVGFFVFKCD